MRVFVVAALLIGFALLLPLTAPLAAPQSSPKIVVMEHALAQVDELKMMSRGSFYLRCSRTTSGALSKARRYGMSSTIRRAIELACDCSSRLNYS